jgi:hypothetical protein
MICVNHVLLIRKKAPLKEITKNKKANDISTAQTLTNLREVSLSYPS